MFHKFGNNERITQILGNRRALPVIVFPGILGDGNDFNVICNKLSLAGIKNIYVFYDERFQYLEMAAKKITLDELVESAADELQNILPAPAGSFPVIFLGYSAGCTWSTKIAQEMVKRKENPYVYNIDGAAPQCLAETLKTPTINSINYLITIINYLAKYAGLYELLPAESNIDSFKDVSLDETIDLLINKIKEKNFSESYEYVKFECYMEIIKTNLHHFIDYTSDANMLKLKNLTALITKETAEKYGQYAGWDAFAEKINLIPSEYLQRQNHFDLMQNNEVTDQLVSSLYDFINNCITKKEFKTMWHNYVAKSYETSDDDANISDIDININLLKKSQRIKISSKSSSSCASPILRNSPALTDNSLSPHDTDPDEEDDIIKKNQEKNKTILTSSAGLFSFQQSFNEDKIIKQAGNTNHVTSRSHL